MKNIVFKSKILLPEKNADFSKWAVVACDQFTSQQEYWQQTEKNVAGQNSTLNIILPEVYLEKPNVQDKIDNIHKTMENYQKNVLTNVVDGMIYVERTTQSGVRKGLVACIDLQDYSFEKGALPLIRPSENTVVERIPPRLKVREGAMLETPHIMMLIDDNQTDFIGKLEKVKDEQTVVYSAKLMQDGGNITGYAITDEKTIAEIQQNFVQISTQNYFDNAYPLAKGDKPMVMAVGDGNHSLATAKAYWEKIKTNLTDEQLENHPARYCLVEIVNVHQQSIIIEPIHRVLFGISKAEFLDLAKQYFGENIKIEQGVDINLEKEKQHSFMITCENQEFVLTLDTKLGAIPVATCESFVEYVLKNNQQVKVDYIHGEDVVKKLSAENAVGIVLPNFEKRDLFKGVVLGGVLPRKTFSMGHAEEKRYYVECRAITK